MVTPGVEAISAEWKREALETLKADGKPERMAARLDEKIDTAVEEVSCDGY